LEEVVVGLKEEEIFFGLGQEEEDASEGSEGGREGGREGGMGGDKGSD